MFGQEEEEEKKKGEERVVKGKNEEFGRVDRTQEKRRGTASGGDARFSPSRPSFVPFPSSVLFRFFAWAPGARDQRG
jgi:hypothetical protein